MVRLRLSNISVPVESARNVKNFVCKQFKIRTED